MSKNKSKFAEFKYRLQEEIDNTDTEQAQQNADEILMEIALSVTLTLEERKLLVNMYAEVAKWYN